MKNDLRNSMAVLVTAGFLTGCGATLERHDSSADQRYGYDLLVPTKPAPKVLGSRGVVPNPVAEGSTQVVAPAPVTALPTPVQLPEPTPMADVKPVAEPAPVLPPLPEVKPAPDQPAAPALTYKVQKGDSIWKIARMHGVKMQDLAAENNISLSKPLMVGKVMRIPAGGTAPDPSKIKPSSKPASKKATSSSQSKRAVNSGDFTPKGKQAMPASGVYKVQSGDSLWVIGHRFGVSVNDLKSMNNLKSNNLKVGQELKLKSGASTKPAPKPAPQPKPVPQPVTPKQLPELKPEPIKPIEPIQPIQPIEPVTPKNEPAPKVQPIEPINDGGLKPLAPLGDTPEKVEEAGMAPIEIPASPVKKSQPVKLIIESWQTLELIAEDYSVDVEELKKLNPNAKFEAGEEILVPVD